MRQSSMSLLFLLLLTFGTKSQAQVVINEFMAINDSLSSITDPVGEHDDWVELFNNGTSSVNLSQWYFSDTLPTPNIFQFPTGLTIAANGFIIMWCDEDLLQEGLHTNFKLNADGEDLLLSDAALNPIDSYTFGPQTNNTSMSRIPNGTGNFIKTTTTFNTFNSTTGNNDIANTDLPIKLITSELPALLFEESMIGAVQVRVYSLSGQLIAGQQIDSPSKDQKVDLGGYWTSGQYIISIQTKQGQQSFQYFRP